MCVSSLFPTCPKRMLAAVTLSCPHPQRPLLSMLEPGALLQALSRQHALPSLQHPTGGWHSEGFVLFLFFL